jgi:hypothetical protein
MFPRNRAPREGNFKDIRMWLVLHATPRKSNRCLHWVDPTVMAATIAAIASVIGAIAGGIITSSNQPKVSCAQVVEEYRRLVVDNHVPPILLTEQGRGGDSMLSSDENAHRCGLGSSTIEELAK